MSVYINFLKKLLIGSYIATASVAPSAPISAPKAVSSAPKTQMAVSGASLMGVVSKVKMDIPAVPFFSQFEDISDPEWQKLGCGIADLAMLIELYKPGIVSVDTLLQEGIDSGAFIDGAGWSHAGLVALAGKYGLTGQTYDFSGLDKNSALAELAKLLQKGPVIASVYYKFEFGNPIPHLAVINGVTNGKVFYNDPAEVFGGYEISIQDFQMAWKKRAIAIRPMTNN